MLIMEIIKTIIYYTISKLFFVKSIDIGLKTFKSLTTSIKKKRLCELDF
jgi:hypothetical protein